MSAREAEERLYLGPAGAKLAAERRKAEEREADDDDLTPPGPVVVLARIGEAYTAYVDPPLPSGDHRTGAMTKDAAWHAARDLWQRFRLGLRDESNPNIGRFLNRE